MGHLKTKEFTETEEEKRRNEKKNRIERRLVSSGKHYPDRNIIFLSKRGG